MFFKQKKRAEATVAARNALGITHLGEEAVGQALGVSTPPPPAPSPIPSDPIGHLTFASRAVARMDDEEARIRAEIEEEECRHIDRNRELVIQLRNTIKTRSFYAAAPEFLGPEVAPATPPKSRPRSAKIKPAEVAANE